MAEGRDEVGAARDWLREHGVVVPDGSTAPTGASDADASGLGAGGAGGARDGRGEDGPAGSERGAGSAESWGRRQPHDSGARRGRRRRPGRGGPGRDETDLDGDGVAEGGGDADGVTAGGADGGTGGGADTVFDGRGRRRRAGDQADGPDADPEQVARTIVLRKLTAQSRTRAELERALRTKAVPEEAASAVLDRMGEVGLVDDAAFARDWVASRQQRRHLSRTALRRELQTKGVDRDVIDEALADVDGADEHRAALDLAQRKASTMGGLPREVAYRRLGGVLARRGFSASVTGRVLSEVLGATDTD